MACFIVPAGEALLTTAAQKILEKKSADGSAASEIAKKLRPLNGMLWGGSALLMFEHVWHGEVVPWYPFLTAMSDPADAAEMFAEMGSVGVSMAVVVTGAWLIGVAVTSAVKARAAKAALSQEVSS
ncbi:MAG: hypothetical protein IKR73_02790 [Oscillospiraceae bacterium]|nr:hypothetical protein [Oscillospiraceae bacterium]